MKKIILFLFVLINNNQLQSQTIGLTQHDTGSLDDGYVLFAPILSTNTYLIDKCGKQVKTWTSTYRPGQSCYILPDGTLLRTGNANNTTFTAGGKGGIIQKIDWNGNVTWNYTISSTLECQHHDIKALPNGNVLAIVWESKTNTEAISQGRNPSLVPTRVWSEKIIEIQQTGLTTGTIVWEWHLWDHLIQDFDTTKPNFNTINTNSQLLNINYNASATTQDWIHMNSIDYNPTLDQIVLSSHAFNEIWIIDHSTSTAQAASHTGGNSGKGGDLLYRWGNSLAYNTGTTKQFFGQHNAHWIEAGLPYENQIMVFNNGNGRTGGNYSTIEIINPPVNGFNYTQTLPYLPASTSWIYNAGNPNSFYAMNISGAQQLANGNVIFANGPSGTFSEITSTGTKVWNYINPVTGTGTLTQGATPAQNLVFRCSFYPSNFSGFAGHTLTTGTIIENSNVISASCNLTLEVNEITADVLQIYPNPAQDFITIHVPMSKNDWTVTITNELGQIITQQKNTSTNTTVNTPTDTLQNGIYFVEISDGKIGKSYKVIINK
jgi:Arylsulfotransferase (ASST)/Secretion system C-terminal sorting domain